MSDQFRYFMEPGDAESGVWRANADVVEFKGRLGHWHASALFDSIRDLLGPDESELQTHGLVEVSRLAAEGGAS